MAMKIHEMKEFSINEFQTDADTFRLYLEAAGKKAPQLDADARARARQAIEAVRAAAESALEQLKAEA